MSAMTNPLRVSPFGCQIIGGSIYVPFLDGVLSDGTKVRIFIDYTKNITSDNQKAMKTAEELHKSYKGKKLTVTIL